MKKNAIITGSDKKYFPFLNNLVNSLNKTNCLDVCDLCILDVENDSEYLKELENKISKKEKAKFSLDIKFEDKKDWFKLLTERPFMKDYFPGYEKYIWMDADTAPLSDNFLKEINLVKKKDIFICNEYDDCYLNNNKDTSYKKIFKLFSEGFVYATVITGILYYLIKYIAS